MCMCVHVRRCVCKCEAACVQMYKCDSMWVCTCKAVCVQV